MTGRVPVAVADARWLQANHFTDLPARLLNELNARIGDPDAAIGPSYFMTDKIQQPGQLQRIWTHAIMPVLRERFFGMSASTLDKFTFEAVWAAISTGSFSSSMRCATRSAPTARSASTPTRPSPSPKRSACWPRCCRSRPSSSRSRWRRRQEG